jgi:hypothetical protein
MTFDKRFSLSTLQRGRSSRIAMIERRSLNETARSATSKQKRSSCATRRVRLSDNFRQKTVHLRLIPMYRASTNSAVRLRATASLILGMITHKGASADSGRSLVVALADNRPLHRVDSEGRVARPFWRGRMVQIRWWVKNTQTS